MLSSLDMSPVFTASHEILFEEEEATPAACDACGDRLPANDVDDEHLTSGHGVYLWVRGGEVRFEKAPLCAACGTAIGVMAYAQWAIEEEEG